MDRPDQIYIINHMCAAELRKKIVWFALKFYPVSMETSRPMIENLGPVLRNNSVEYGSWTVIALFHFYGAVLVGLVFDALWALSTWAQLQLLGLPLVKQGSWVGAPGLHTTHKLHANGPPILLS